jgi:hypothetical protein
LCLKIINREPVGSKRDKHLTKSQSNLLTRSQNQNQKNIGGRYVQQQILKNCGMSDSSPTESNFKVYARIKPVPNSHRLLKADKNRIYIDMGDDGGYYNSAANQSFELDSVFWDEILNSQIFDETIKPILPNLLEGFNITTLAYGVTGSGKTYTMFGNGFETLGRNIPVQDQVKGISLLTIEHLFHLLDAEKDQLTATQVLEYEYFIEISYLEVYNEKIIDLLRKDQQSQLAILENSESGIVIPGLK